MYKKEELGISTKPEITDRVLITEGSGFEGYQVVEYKNLVWGVASLQSTDDSRRKAVDSLIAEAKNINANAIINFRFEKSTAGNIEEEITAIGNAVTIKPIENYAPVGSLANIFAEFLAYYTKDEVKYDNTIHEARYSSTSTYQKSEPKVKASPICEVVAVGEREYAICPECGMKHNVNKDASGNLNVMGLKDVDDEEDGLQIFCIRCGKKFTIPEKY